MQHGAEVKVGLIALLGTALLAVFAFYIMGLRASSATYPVCVMFANAQSILLGNTGNAFTGNVTLNGAGAGVLNNVTFTDSGGVSIGTGGSLTFEGGNLSLNGNLVVTASTGNITDNGTVTVGGTAGFTTSAANATINLGTLAVTGAVSVNTNGATGDATDRGQVAELLVCGEVLHGAKGRQCKHA